MKILYAILCGIGVLALGVGVVSGIRSHSLADAFSSDYVTSFSTFFGGAGGVATSTYPMPAAGFGSTTALTVGNDPGTSTPGTFVPQGASTTIYLTGHSQFSIISATGTPECAFWGGTGLITITGACTP